MKYAGIIYNDFAAAPGVSLTFFTQGCPHRCPGCHNPETWDFDKGLDFTEETMQSIVNGLHLNGIKRNFCLMGGEPLCAENLDLSLKIIKTIKETYDWVKIYIWTGYTYEVLTRINNPKVNEILSLSNIIIDGPYIEKLKDTSLNMRGSSNQRIIDLTKEKKNDIIK
jgi:anaerobic ribonucleoside-triphosphate reductase activating protein